MKSLFYGLTVAFLCLFLGAPAASAQGFIVTTPYWCGSYWSSYPCTNVHPTQVAAPYYSQSYYAQPNYYTTNAYQYSTPAYQYPQNYSCTYSGGSTYCPAAAPAIYSLSNTSGAVGNSITIYGSGFSASGNSVRFGRGIINNLFSQDGRTLSFTIPQSLQGYGVQQTLPGTYDISVITAAGTASNSMQFVVNTQQYWGSGYWYGGVWYAQ